MSEQVAIPTLATIIPCHNNADTLERAIYSALIQPELDELVIVVDGASDNSLLVAQKFAQSDPRVRAIGLATCSGPSLARNLGAAAATTDILCFLDADDEHLPGYYAFAKATLAANPQWAGLKSGIQIIDLPDDLSCEDSDPRYMAVVCSAPWNLAMRRPLFWLAGGFPQGEAFRGKIGSEDTVFNTAFRECFDVRFTPQKFCRHYNRPGSHLEVFLRRARVVDGTIHFNEFLPEELDGSLRDATVRHVAQAVANQSMPSLKTAANRA